MERYSLYLHVPFCRHRCSYCDFNTYAGQERLIPAYVAALCQEIEQVSRAAPERISAHTIFFGGGTPSLLTAEQIGAVLAQLQAGFDFPEGLDAAEVTIEANPGTVSPDYLRALRRVGVNRLSFGMQSAHPDDLRLLERQHDFFDVAQAVRWARAAGFDNLSLDLIFGLPQQDLARWAETLDRALGTDPEHLSLYALIIEHGTPLQKRWARGLVPVVDDDLAADMYELAQARLGAAGFEQYEISNWARRGADGRLLASRHNLQYWYNQPYLGFGAGAHGYAGGFRTANVGGIKPYIERCTAPANPALRFPSGPATRRLLAIDRRMDMQETMMVGLRLTQAGVDAGDFQTRYGEPLEDVFGPEIERLTHLGLLEWVPEPANGTGSPGPHTAVCRRLRLTPRGVLLGNQVFMQFVGE